MGILILNLGRTTGWAVYQNDKTKKITSGTHKFRDKKYFSKFLDKMLYDHSIDKVYCQTSKWTDRYIYFKVKKYLGNYKWLNIKDSCSDVLGSAQYNEQKMIDRITTLGHLPDSTEENYAIVSAYYACKL